MYRVMCIYNTEFQGHPVMPCVGSLQREQEWVPWVGEESMQVPLMLKMMQISFVNEPPILPVSNDWAVGVIQGGVACIGMMAKGATPKAECILWVLKGMYQI